MHFKKKIITDFQFSTNQKPSFNEGQVHRKQFWKRTIPGVSQQTTDQAMTKVQSCLLLLWAGIRDAQAKLLLLSYRWTVMFFFCHLSFNMHTFHTKWKLYASYYWNNSLYYFLNKSFKDLVDHIKIVLKIKR